MFLDEWVTLFFFAVTKLSLLFAASMQAVVPNPNTGFDSYSSLTELSHAISIV